MDKQTFSSWGAVISVILVVAIMMSFATPFGQFVTQGVQSLLSDFKVTADKALDVSDVGGSGGNGNNSPVLEGDGQTFYKESPAPLSFHLNSPITDLEEIMVGGQVVDSSNYTVAEGNEIITILAEYLAQLENKDFTMTIVSKDGTTEISFTVTNNAPAHAEGEHSFKVKTVAAAYLAAEATCDQPTTYYYRCICGEIGTQTFTVGSPKPHTPGAAADCTTAQTCTICGAEITAANGHTPGKPASCETAQTCTVCGAELVAALGHSFNEGVCTNCGAEEVTTLAPGLYDAEDNLIASWDTLVNTYGMDVEKNYTASTYKTDTASPYYILTNNTELTNGAKLVIGEATKIGEYAFHECTNIVSVNLPDGVTSIGNYAFRNCTGLTSINIPDGVTSIERSAFSGCSGLTSIDIPDSVTSIGSSAFYGCTNLTSIDIPDSVTSIGSSAFYGCTNLTSVDIPDGVTKIDETTFYNCSNLTSVTIPSGVTSIGISTFSNCTSLTSIEIPSSVTTINAYAFKGCTGLASITISSGVTKIDFAAFQNCTGVTSITIPDGVTSIGKYAFEGCSNLTSVSLPAGITSLGTEIFRYCSNIQTVYFEGSVEKWLALPFVDYYANPCYNGALLYFNNELVENVVVPNNITSINQYAFYRCNSLTSIVIPDSVTNIGYAAFRDCINLDTVTLGGNSNLESVGKYAFYGCTNLTSIVVPDSVKTIGEQAFYNCSALATVTISDNSKLTSIGKSAFAQCKALTGFNIPNGVTNIQGYTFSGCSALKTLVIPASVTSIESDAFRNVLMETLYYNGTVEQWCAINRASQTGSVKKALYINGEIITDLVVPEGVETIGSYTFAGFHFDLGIKSITIPSSVKSIGNNAFVGASIISVTILATEPPTLGTNAFKSTQKIIVPAGCGEAYRTAEGWSAYASNIVEAE